MHNFQNTAYVTGLLKNYKLHFAQSTKQLRNENMTISGWLNTRNFRLKKYFFSLSISSPNVFQTQGYLSVRLIHSITDPGSRAVYSIGLKLADCLQFRFVSLWEHECSSLVSAVCCVGSSICKKLTTHSDELYQVCVIWKPKWWISLDLSLAVAPQKIYILCMKCFIVLHLCAHRPILFSVVCFMMLSVTQFE